MSNFRLNLPADVPWTLVNYNQDMMDTTFCDKKMPSPYRSSIALYTYNPRSEDIPEAYAKCGKQITYLKVSCSITGYQKTEEENQQIIDLLASIKGVDYTKTEDILQEYFGCYGVLLNVSVHPERSFRDDLTRYPHIIDFEPKHHDIYHPASETGEVFTTSNLLTGYHSGTNRASFIMLPPPQVSQPTDRRTFVQGLRAIEGIQDFFLIVIRDKDQPILNVDTFLQTGHFPENINIPSPGADVKFEFMDSIHPVEYLITGKGRNPLLDGNNKVDMKISEKLIDESNGWEADPTKGDTGRGGVKEIKNVEIVTIPEVDTETGFVLGTHQQTLSVESGHISNVDYRVTAGNLIVTAHLEAAPDWGIFGGYGITRYSRAYQLFMRRKKLNVPTPVADVSGLLIIQRKLCTRITYSECISGTDVSGFDGTLGLADGALSGEVDFNLDELINPDKIDRGVNPGIGDSVNPDIVTGRVTNSPFGSDLAIKNAILRKIQNTMMNTASSPVFLKGEKTGFLQTKHFQKRLLKLLPKEVLDSSAHSFDFINPKAKEKISKEISLRELFSKSDLLTLKQFGIAKNEILKVKKPNIGNTAQ